MTCSRPSQAALGLMMIASAFAVVGGSRADETAWKVGLAKVTITPSRPVVLLGYGDRTGPFESVATEIFAKALALEDRRGQHAVIVTADLVGFQAAVVTEEVCRQIHPPQRRLLRARGGTGRIDYRSRTGDRRRSAHRRCQEKVVPTIAPPIDRVLRIKRLARMARPEHGCGSIGVCLIIVKLGGWKAWDNREDNMGADSNGHTARSRETQVRAGSSPRRPSRPCILTRRSSPAESPDRRGRDQLGSSTG